MVNYLMSEQLADFIQNVVKAAMTEFMDEHEFNMMNRSLIYNDARYLTRHQVSQYLGIGLSTVDYWAKNGKLNKLKIDGSVRFDKAEIDESIKTLRKYRRVNSYSSTSKSIRA